ncbi:MAG: hypothetical protein Q3990_09675 [Desulfovibrionaceae bacterium]|nr:hypothetical protein [Desulfovibrionaceae bacterium]
MSRSTITVRRRKLCEDCGYAIVEQQPLICKRGFPSRESPSCDKKD